MTRAHQTDVVTVSFCGLPDSVAPGETFFATADVKNETSEEITFTIDVVTTTGALLGSLDARMFPDEFAGIPVDAVAPSTPGDYGIEVEVHNVSVTTL